ncbi:Lpg1974 family pore-forming outer membrane protein [Legionella clemsonensis]|uniref:Legionella pneumophila major outer membrane protein n=1 Tax=Legionella clemsonensis TaxID=1867846 RepID=A0A222NYL5_9GAMM|nr:Lpg1974 family pore-forming outer membrane protein [Legionella clemsonensis]ASQ44687.1 Legionella pneumophila major outer membrane protein precursor [Legionella clemsonensis]
MLKKTTLAILGLAASSLVSAGSMGPTCVPGDVTVPCEVKKWDIGVQALYLQPVYSLHRGYELTPVGTLREIDEDWDWGYRLEGSYHFNTGNDITMTWVHFDNESDHYGYAGFTPFTGPLPFALSLDTRFDQVNLVMGQHVDMGLVKNARFYGGLQYARIRRDMDYTYTPLPATGFFQERDADFNGVGPVVGIDYSYDLINGFSITANGAASLLYGSSRYNDSFILVPANLVAVDIYASKKSIVPSLEAKLGLNYAHEMAQGTFNIEGGYQVINYFDALHALDLNCNCLQNSDFGLYGPYLGVKWVGNI